MWLKMTQTSWPASGRVPGGRGPIRSSVPSPRYGAPLPRPPGGPSAGPGQLDDGRRRGRVPARPVEDPDRGDLDDDPLEEQRQPEPLPDQLVDRGLLGPPEGQQPLPGG